MNKLDLLEHIYAGHSCSNCDHHIFCKDGRLCDRYCEMTDRTKIAVDIARILQVPPEYISASIQGERDYSKAISKLVKGMLDARHD